MTINVFGGGYNPLAPVFPVQRSVRFRSSASAYFNRTFGTPTDSTKFTWSAWVKRGALNAVRQGLIGRYIDGNNLFRLFFDTNDTLVLNDTQAASTKCSVVTNAVFRDPSAWYHIVVAIDTANGTAANRQIIYVNGVQQTFSSATNYSATSLFNVASAANTLGLTTDVGPTNRYFDGYMTEVNFVDGQQLTPSSFGSYNAGSGVWQPIRYSGTYGTNGFYLNFQDNSGATATTIGKDNSGNGNNWTPNNISVTAGVTYDSMLDVPTLTSATNANFCTYLPLATVPTGGGTALATLTNGNLNASSAAANFYDCFSTFDVPTSGKWYFEWTVTTVGTNHYLGLGSRSSWTASSRIYVNSGQKSVNGTLSAYGASYTSGDIIGCAIDMDAGTLVMYKNNATQGTLASDLLSALPASGWAIVGEMRGTAAHSVNFGQQPFTYTPPTGYKTINTYNLPAPTIPNGAAQMAATLYTGTGAALSVANTVNGVSFQPDFVWVKGRSGATDHALYDSVRGTTKQIESNTSAIETTEATGLTAFGTSGFTVGALAQMNTNTATYVGWQWKASNAAAVTNTAGTITSSVSANTTAGFSIVSFTNVPVNASTYTIGHGLGIAPKFYIVKNRNLVDDWYCYQESIGATKRISLNTTAAAAIGGIWGNTAPTSSVFSLVGNAMSTSTSQNLIAYCFAEIAGYSKFGSYTGNGSTDGPFVYTGFRPRFILIKSTGVESWIIRDTSRNTYNVADADLFPNLSDAETVSSVFRGTDFLSNGFKLRNTGSGSNSNGVTYIYAAFAENPFSYSLAR
jgi:hypothetical protein